MSKNATTLARTDSAALQQHIFEVVAGMCRGDALATAEFVNYYQSHFLRLVQRRRQRRRELAATVDAIDIFQSALASFLDGVQRKAFHPQSPESCLAILIKIADGKLRRAVDRQRTRCRHCEALASYVSERAQ